ncbi:cellobiose transport system permease protein [Lipingzhangella halophila]|uniref:Cellobiose transport system permease protein n=1 Tax=Lipingzhangella halophila TaxID=1783352 RepID=A0A7W7RM41_9ACTN|nr:sugar ABC transporter permease [Lipingzhangella halophila]MBB4934520.1 cellobiose transport system permease protein [Lipingzhangella halophila]
MSVVKSGARSRDEESSPGAPREGPDPAQRERRERRAALRSRLDVRLSPYLFVSPYFILFGMFGLFPVLFTFWISLHEWGLLTGNQGFIGLENYAGLLGDGKFWQALVNTLGIFLLAIVPQLLIALLLADTLNRRLRFRGFFRVGIIIPYITSIAAMAIIFGQLFGREFGLINYALEMIGVGGVDWPNNRLASWTAIAVMIDWRWIGFNTLIYLAAMQAIPRDLYEAAAIDGASRLRQFAQITIPMVRPTIMFTVIIGTIGQMQLFTEPVIFGQGVAGGTQGQFQTVAMLMFQEAMERQNFGYGSAIAWVIFLLIVVFALINILFVSRIRSAG